MFSEDPILLDETVNRVLLMTVEPAAKCEEEELERGSEGCHAARISWDGAGVQRTLDHIVAGNRESYVSRGG